MKQIKIVTVGETGKLLVNAIDDVIAVNSIDFNEPVQIVAGVEFNDCFFSIYRDNPHYRDLEYNHKRVRQ